MSRITAAVSEFPPVETRGLGSAASCLRMDGAFSDSGPEARNLEYAYDQPAATLRSFATTPLRRSSIGPLLAAAMAGFVMAVAVTLGGVAWSLVGPLPSAGANPTPDCTTTAGVIVAVDFRPWGGTVERGCDPTLTTGYNALDAAGFTTAGDEYDGPAFVCRIKSTVQVYEPTSSQDPCVNTPPANAYWSYWLATAGQNTWSLSGLGAMSYHPSAGSVDAWVFGKTVPPTFLPSAVRATIIGAPIPTTTTTRPVPTTTAAPPATTPPSVPSPASTPPTSSAPANSSAPSNSSAPAGTAVSGGSPSHVVAPTSNAKQTKTQTPTAGASTTTTPPGSGSVTQPHRPTASTATTVVRVANDTAPNAAGTAATRGSAPSGSVSGGSVRSPRIVDVAPVAGGATRATGSGGSATSTLVAVSVVAIVVCGGGLTAWRRRQRAG